MIVRCCAPHKDPRSSSTCDHIVTRLPQLPFEWVFVGIVRWIPEGENADGSAYFQCSKCQAVNKYRVVAPKHAIATETADV